MGSTWHSRHSYTHVHTSSTMDLMDFKTKHMKLKRKNVPGYQSNWRGGDGGCRFGPNTSYECLKFSNCKKVNPEIFCENITELHLMRKKGYVSPANVLSFSCHLHSSSGKSSHMTVDCYVTPARIQKSD